MPDKCENNITIGELIERLSEFPKSADITFGCTEDGAPLCFYRVKSRHSEHKLIQIELSELHD